MEMSEKLSIIIPTYNVEKYIEKCLKSAIAQNYTNFEIIIIDDGSTDKSGKICDNYAEKYSNIKVFHTQNCGLSAARNLGLRNATGKYIAFLDSDDYIDASMYLKLINAIQQENSECAFSRFYEVQPDGSKIIYLEEGIENLCKNPQNMYPLFEQYSWKRTNTAKYSKSMLKCVWRSIFIREIIVNNNIYFDINAKWGEDALFLTEYMMHCHRASFVDEPLYYYVVRKGSLVNQYKRNFLSVRKYLYNRESQLIKKSKIHSVAEKRYLLNELKLINCLAIVLNEVNNKDTGYQNLRDLAKDKFFISLMSWSCIFQSTACNRPIKHLVFALLVKFHAWKLIICLYQKM